MGSIRSQIAAAVRPGIVVAAHRGEHSSDGPQRGAASAARGDPGAGRFHAIVRAPLVALGEHAGRLDRRRIGTRATSIAWLAEQGVPVPTSVAVPADVTAQVAAGDSLATELLAGALGLWLDPARSYDVRPSADNDGASPSPGPPYTRLGVPVGDVLDAVRIVARSDHERLSRHASDAREPVRRPVAVVVHEVTEAAFAGIAFSRNPLTGLDEVVVEAVVQGDGALASDGAEPDRWIRRWGTYIEEPSAPRVPAAVIEAVARETGRLARAYGRPIDLEWTSDGTAITWLGARPMTGLDDLRVYSNRIARDVLPGVIRPLVWSVNVPVVNTAWIELLEELVGPLHLQPQDLARSFGCRAYFDMTTLGSVFEALGMPRDSLELLLGLPKGPEAPRFRPSGSTLRHLPRVLASARRTLRRGRWTRAEVRELDAAYAGLAGIDPAEVDETALLTRVDDLVALSRRAAYANIIVPLVMLGYERALGLQLRAAGVDAASVNPAATRRDRAGWDPNTALDGLRVLAAALPVDAREALATRRWAAIEERDDLPAMRAALGAFIARFGDLSDSSNDFSRPTWREDRDAVLDLVLAHPKRAEAAGGLDLAAVEARLPRLRRPLVRFLWRRSGAFRVYREAVGATWTRCYGLFRGTFLALGRRLVERGVLDVPDDVFYLAVDEVRTLATGGTLGEDEARAVVARRRAEVAEAADLMVPEIVYGDAFVPRRRDEQVRATLQGIPTARGSVRGTARVVRAAADFARVAAGDVIVIPFSDVAWTPLFARAGGVIAEAGGILSHSSIVAREYGIPCIVSVPGACSLIPDGASVIVDGTTGVVLVEGAQPADRAG
jgi:phosphohistidine swiveling domain-containing protein